MRFSPARRPLAMVLGGLAIALCGITGCGGEGSQTSCGLEGCTVTFQRNGAGEVSVLGVEARLVSAEGDTATLEVGGNTVTLPVGGEAQLDGFTVIVQEVTADEVVARITP